MKSKPIVMERFFTEHTSFVLNFEFTNNITILTGDSGTGKTASFSFIKECMALNPDIVCQNYLDYQKNIGDIIQNMVKKLIVIDNADILLDDETRKYIALDDKNQYLIMGRNPKNLFTTKENLFELVSERQEEQTVLRIKDYMVQPWKFSKKAAKISFKRHLGNRHQLWYLAAFWSRNKKPELHKSIFYADDAAADETPDLFQESKLSCNR